MFGCLLRVFKPIEAVSRKLHFRICSGLQSALVTSHNAVKSIFYDNWYREDDAGRSIGLQTPRSSRLIHSTGITALGHIMDAAFALRGAETKGQFVYFLEMLKPHCAWSLGTWNFQPTPNQWSEVTNTTRDIWQLANICICTWRQNLGLSDLE